MKRLICSIGLSLFTMAGILIHSTQAGAVEGHQVFLKSAIESAGFKKVTLPIFEGRSHGEKIWFVVTDSSDRGNVNVRGVNFAPKLSNAKGTPAVQKARYVGGLLEFEATVDFSPNRVVVPNPQTGFPPFQLSPGSIGEPGYSPLAELPDGTVLNASHIANKTGQHDKVLSIDFTNGTATFVETEGFYEGDVVFYASFESSDAGVAALEAATWAPNLNTAPRAGSNAAETSARAGIIPFLNGQTGVNNPERQGLNSALLGNGDPKNILQEIPKNVEAGLSVYSPLWDVHMAMWTDNAIAGGSNRAQTDFDTIRSLVLQGLVTGPGGSEFGAANIIVNCPVISINHNHKR